MSFSRLVLLCVLAFLYRATWAQLPYDDNQNNRSVVIDLHSRKNQTGHWITKFVVNNGSPKLPKNWKFHIELKSDYYGGLERLHIQGTLNVPPPIPPGYLLYPGVGYYKFHAQSPGGWDEAYSTCAKEGAHLAIINSVAESNVLYSMTNGNSIYLGIHDRAKEGEFVTIFGEPLSSTGYSAWLRNQPDNAGGKEHCGSYHPDGGLNDLACQKNYPFLCEYDLSWTD